MRRQVSCNGKITAYCASATRGSRLRREAAPMGFQFHCKYFANILPGHFVIFEERQGCGGQAHLRCHPEKPSPAGNKPSRMGENQAVRGLMVVEIRLNSWRQRRCRRHRLVFLCQSGSVVVAGSTVNKGEPCLQRRKVFSMMLARSHSARAHGFDRTARAIALWRRTAIWISCLHLR